MTTWTKGDDAAVCLSYRDHGVKATPELLAALSHLTSGSISMRLQNVEYLATGGARGLSAYPLRYARSGRVCRQRATRPEHLINRPSSTGQEAKERG
jgi:hypothetical protein